MSLETIPLPGAYNTRGGLAVYGPGTDGNVTITGTVVLNRDMYYNNLTVMGGGQLDTNGYRVFVKDTLNMTDATSIIGRLSNKTSVGSILGGAPSGIKASDTLGGNGGLNPGQNFFGEAEFYNFSQAIAGYKFDAVAGTLRFLMGGSGGASGTIGASGATGSFTYGTVGSPGSPGSPGTRPGFETTIGVPGGKGYAGSPGNPATPGSGGLGGAGGTAGAGGAGGGVVIISARNITGSGIIRADGEGGVTGGAGSPGMPGSDGSPGSPGAPGAKAPDFYSASYTYVSQNSYFYTGTFLFYNNPTGGNARTSYNTPTYNATSYNALYYITTFSPFAVSFPTYNSPTPGSARTTPGNARTTPGTPGPASIRYRSPSTTYNAPVTTYNAPTPGNERISYSYSYLARTLTVPSTLNPSTENPGNARTTYTAIVPGTQAYNYNTEFQPEVYAIQPSQYHVGGVGGQGGTGGVGGIGSAGLPGSPGTAGYAGGGGVVLLVTENNIPVGIDVRAAAGTGDGGLATSGTVIIIKNEAVKDGN